MADQPHIQAIDRPKRARKQTSPMRKILATVPLAAGIAAGTLALTSSVAGAASGDCSDLGTGAYSSVSYSANGVTVGQLPHLAGKVAAGDTVTVTATLRPGCEATPGYVAIYATASLAWDAAEVQPRVAFYNVPGTFTVPSGGLDGLCNLQVDHGTGVAPKYIGPDSRINVPGGPNRLVYGGLYVPGECTPPPTTTTSTMPEATTTTSTPAPTTSTTPSTVVTPSTTAPEAPPTSTTPSTVVTPSTIFRSDPIPPTSTVPEAPTTTDTTPSTVVTPSTILPPDQWRDDPLVPAPALPHTGGGGFTATLGVSIATVGALAAAVARRFG